MERRCAKLDGQSFTFDGSDLTNQANQRIVCESFTTTNWLRSNHQWGFGDLIAKIACLEF
eukprot:521020-Karenia_brevis.AAC.1